MRRSPPMVYSFLAAMGVLFLLHLNLITLPGRTPDPNDQHNLVALPIVGALFCLANAIFLMGWKRAVRLLLIAATIGWLAEQMGVHYGLVFGHYHYTDRLGPKFVGVPLVIPLFWFMLTYLSYVITSLITVDAPEDTGQGDLVHDLWVALLGALVVTAYDLGLDPYLASPEVHAWVWDPPPPASSSYFGIPVKNFYGWITVAFLILFTLRRLDRRQVAKSGPLQSGLQDLSPRMARAVALMPVAFYVTFWLQHISHTYTPPVIVVSLVALGTPAMAAVSNWRRWHFTRELPQPNPTASPAATTTVVTRTS